MNEKKINIISLKEYMEYIGEICRWWSQKQMKIEIP